MREVTPSLHLEVEVPLLDLKLQYQQIRAEVLERIAEICERQSFILGPFVKELEREVAEYSQCRFGIGVSSGTDALLLALMALKVGPGDEVITTPYTFFATAGVIARLGARPLFCDIDPVIFNIAPTAIEALLSKRCKLSGKTLTNRDTGGIVKAIIPVHLYGQMADMDPIMEVARRHGLRVIEDSAQAIGSEYNGDARAASGISVAFRSFQAKISAPSAMRARLCLPRISPHLQSIRHPRREARRVTSAPCDSEDRYRNLLPDIAAHAEVLRIS